MIELKNIIENSNYTYDEFYLNKYLSFIQACQSLNNLDEKHHILPRSMFKEYENSEINLIYLSYKNHLIAHFLLYKTFNSTKKMIFAFNMMVNRCKKMNKNIKLTKEILCDYENFRKTLSKTISKINKNRKMSDKNKKLVSERTKNTLVVKDKDNNYKRVDKNNYDKEKYKPYRIGYKHKKETIKKIIKNNGLKGKKCYNNGVDIKYMNEPNDEFNIEGQIQSFKNNCKENNKKIFIYNPLTNQQKRIKETVKIPKGFMRKRVKKGSFRGFENINKNVNVYDIRYKKHFNLNKSEYDNKYHIKNYGLNKNKRFFITVNNFVFYNIQTLDEFLQRNYNIFIIKTTFYKFCKEYVYKTVKMNYNNTNKKYIKYVETHKCKKIIDVIREYCDFNIFTEDDFNFNNKVIWRNDE